MLHLKWFTRGYEKASVNDFWKVPFSSYGNKNFVDDL